MKTMNLLVAAALAAAVLAGSASAAGGSAGLTDADVRAFAKVYPKFVKWASARNKGIARLAKGGAPAVQMVPLAMQVPGADAFLKQHGTSLREFSVTAGRVSRAAINVGKQDAFAKVQNTARSAVSADTRMPYQQKAAALKSIDSSQPAMAAMIGATSGANAGDNAAVQRNSGALSAAMGQQAKP